LTNAKTSIIIYHYQMRRSNFVRPIVRAAARLLLLLSFGAGQAVIAAHVHEIVSPARTAAVRRADAREASADCPICQFAAQARSCAATPFAAPPSVQPSVVLALARIEAPASRRVCRAAARAPPVVS